VKNREKPNDAADVFEHHAYTKTIEVSDLANSPPTTIVSNLPGELRNFLWLSNGRLILLVSEPDINLYSCNYWEQPVNARTGQPRGALRKMTDWAGFCMDHMSATADGKRLVFKRWWIQRSVYVSDLRFKPFRITPPRRLSHNEANEVPVGWTADSQSVIFLSNRTHSWDIFRQALGEEQAESIATASNTARRLV
jgi:Tol biopolymer transport system component